MKTNGFPPQPSLAEQKHPFLYERSRVFKRVFELILLPLLVCAIWLTIEDRWGNNFSIPTRYEADSHYILGMMKLAKDGDLGLFTHIETSSLGAPFRGQLNDFIEAERVIVWLGGQIARVTGLMPAANTMVLLSCVVASVSFYASARLWRISNLHSFVFAIIYAFLPQSQRSLDHLGIAFSGLLPLQFYCCWYLATVQKVSWRSFRFKLTLAVGLLSGFLNIYWIFFFTQLYTLALLCRIAKRRSGFVISLIPLTATFLTTGLLLGSFVVYRISNGVNTAALVRSYFDVERWALKPIDLLLPKWGTDLGIASGFFSRYYDGGRLEVGEGWGAYIGVCAICGLLLLFCKEIRRQLNKRSPSLPYLALCWIMAYSSFGGIHAIVSFILNYYDIRATNRYSAAIAALGLLYFAFIINRLMRNWSFRAKLCSLIFLASLAILDQSPIIQKYASRSNNSIKERVIADRNLVLRLESSLGEGAMIYTLPAVDFPEPFQGRGAYMLNYFFYNSMRPFLFSTKLRYSYGSNKGRQGADWQLDVQELPAGEMAATLESYGFSGILLDRKGYADGGEQRLAELAKAGWPVEFDQGVDNEWVFIRLTPRENPVLPTLTPYKLSESH